MLYSKLGLVKLRFLQLVGSLTVVRYHVMQICMVSRTKSAGFESLQCRFLIYERSEVHIATL